MFEKIKNQINQTYDKTAFSALGIKFIKVDLDETIVSLVVDDRHRQPAGLVHGGIYVLMAETAASIAAYCSLPDDSKSNIVGLDISANHISAVRSGTLTAKSQIIHHGKRTLVYDIKITNEEEKLISIARCTLMVV